MNTEYAVKTRNLTKVYNNKPAVDHVDMKVRQGEIYGFIGRNGAGKSTTLKMICGLAHPTEGEIALYGAPVTDRIARRRVGMLIESAGLYPNLTAKENMILKAQCLGLLNYDSIDHVMNLMNISNTGKKKTKQFSMGMKQRLGVAMALLGNPDLLILDEPINGLDPEGIREIRECLLRLNEEEGKTILISSHILGELSKIATNYGIIKDGRLIRQMTKDELEDQCRDYLLVEVDHAEKAAAILAEKLPDAPYKVFAQGRIHIYDYLDSGQVTTLLVQNGITVLSCGLHQIDLEQYFLDLMEGGAHNA